VLSRLQYLLLTTLASISLVLMVASMILFTQNRAAQAEVASRAQYVQQTLQLQPLFQEMVKALADLAVRRGDDALRELLVSQGMQVPQTPPAASTQTPPAASTQPAPAAAAPGAPPKGAPRK
jgi:hypothetical protein